MHRFRSHRRSINEAGHAHELTFSCFHGYPFLAKERCCNWLADSIGEACEKLDFHLWAYVFMPTHVHLIVHPQEVRYDIALFLSQVKQPVSRKAVAFLKQESPDWLQRLSQTRGERTEHHFWQRGGGYDRNVTEPSTLKSMLEYVHLNPVRKGLVKQAREWKWSSAGWFVGEAPNHLKPDKIPAEWIR